MTGATIFYAFGNLPLAEVYAIIFATLLTITALSVPLLREKVGVFRWSAILVGLVGVLIVLRPGVSPLSAAHISAIIAVFSGAIVSVTIRKIGRNERTGVLQFYPMVSNLLVMAIILPFVWVTPNIVALGVNAIISGLGFVGMLALYRAYRSAPAAIVAPMHYSQILWATALGAIFFGESLEPRVGIGAAIIVASGVFVLWRESRMSHA